MIVTFINLTSQEVPQYSALLLKIDNPNTYKNPYDYDEISLTADVESPSGKVYKIYGYYNEENNSVFWNLRIMPTEKGVWKYNYSWSDGTAGGNGEFICIESNIKKLKIDGDKIKFNGNVIFPLMIPTRELIQDKDFNTEHKSFYSWAKNIVGAKFIGTTLIYFINHKNVAYYKNSQGEWVFNPLFWNRLNLHFDKMRDMGLGVYILIFSDDENNPTVNGVLPYSKEEKNLFKYLLARFSSYPSILFDSGIDISEYRDNNWINYFISWFHENDPYRNPISSRFGGGSGGINSNISDYESNGEKYYPDIKGLKTDKSKPTIFTDRWREYYSRPEQNYWNETTIPKVIWELSLLKGYGAYISGNLNNGYLNENYKSDLISASKVGNIIYFFENIVNDYNLLKGNFNIESDGNLSGVNTDEIITSFYFRNKVNLNLQNYNGYYWLYIYNLNDKSYQKKDKIIAGSEVIINNPDISEDNIIHLIKVKNYQLKLLNQPESIFNDETLSLTFQDNNIVDKVNAYFINNQDTLYSMYNISFSKQLSFNIDLNNIDTFKVKIVDSKLSTNFVETDYIKVFQRNRMTLRVDSTFIQEHNDTKFYIFHESGEKEVKLCYTDNGVEKIIKQINIIKDETVVDWKVPLITDEKVSFYLKNNNNEVLTNTDSVKVYDRFYVSDFNLSLKDSSKVILSWLVNNEYFNKGYLIKKMIGAENHNLWSFENDTTLKASNNNVEKEYRFIDYSLHYDTTVYYYLYSVTSNNDTLLLDSNYYKLRTTGIEELEDSKFQCSIFPNPLTNNLNLDINSIEKSLTQIKIYNSIGMEVFNRKLKINKGYNHLSVSTVNLSSGIYYMLISTENNSKYLKFVVLR